MLPSECRSQASTDTLGFPSAFVRGTPGLDRRRVGEKKGFPWRGQLGLEFRGASGQMIEGDPGLVAGHWLCFLAVAVVASTQAA